MSFEHWLAFAVASAILVAIPGPTVLLVVSYALGHGRRAALATTAGAALGDLTAMTLSMFGLGMLLAESAALFAALKWIGAAYLIFLGLKMWRSPPSIRGDGAAAAPAETRPARIFAHAYAVTTLNPKSLIFFIAFVPQFISTQIPAVQQMVVFEATFVTLAALNAFGYAMLASAARSAVRRPRTQRIVNRAGGTLLIGAGLATVVWRRAAA